MTPIQDCIINKNHKSNPIWIMRQAGRYLPEFREIRAKNPDFIKLCLNEHLSSEITLQPLKRFDLDAAIIFSDILMLPYGIGQDVKFKKNFGPELSLINYDKIKNTKEKDFIDKLKPIYNLLKILSNNKIIKNKKDLIGFVGAPWTLLVYMINQKSPKLKLNDNFFSDKNLIKNLLNIIEKFLKLHIKNQIKNGATIIQIFDSWAGLVEEKNLAEYIYNPTLNLVNYIKSLNVPVICFPREIKNYKDFCNIVNPSVISIDYNIRPEQILKNVDLPVQGGLDPKILLEDKEVVKKEASKYLEAFKDWPYIFNLGHGILPETKPETVDYLVKFIKDAK
jgi:uroporphyrinogen decarboxylase